ncbi:DNA internalization-related competence protein ComEC/Rec2 [Pasteurellaceae bacterium USgator11]|nr:DNA internalization-related competence protein ComEC/Rec2 [Pasteurellaceae bacterium UScroc12]TNG96172.1 DNA internalization-related competence protein ComEC/Rec2 [Pasteurellaceae bacterium USgator41]TNG97988.1 DNA internalization-related competence protein ComEC/Rec2 [Pasteurellaceae bacterium UScroc31]TNH00153.1 DNA internalization-related competence protein ComEC/Rec2 [Pasteurellaceae bacterium USgator11]
MKLQHVAVCWLLSLTQIVWLPADWLGYHGMLLLLAILPLVLLSMKPLRRRYRTGLWSLFFILLSAAYQQYEIAATLSKAEQIVALRQQNINVEFKIIALRQMLPNRSVTVVAQADLADQGLGKIKINLNWQLDEQPHLGQVWRANLKLRPLSTRLNDGGFNRQRWLLSQSILAGAVVKQGQLLFQQNSWRQQKLASVLTETETLRYQGVILALAFGERGWMNADDWQKFRESGTAHLIAISGLHIGLVAWLGWGVARLLQLLLIGLGLKIHYVTYHVPHLAALSAAVCYAYLADFLIPTQRALWAYCFWLAFIFMRIHLPAWKLLLLIVAWLSLIDPLSVLNESFWLSCGTVALLCCYYHCVPLAPLLQKWRWRGKSLKQAVPPLYWLCGLFHLQFGLLLLFTPLQLLLFNALPTGSFLSNLLLVPFFSFVIIPLILLALFSGGMVWSWVDSLLAQALLWLEALPNTYLTLAADQQWLIITVCLSLFLLLLGLTHRYRTLNSTSEQTQQSISGCKPLTICTLLIVLCCSKLWAITACKSEWKLVMLDVGQGLAVLIITERSATLFDTGQAWQGGSMAEAEILPFLRRSGLQLEQLIISHDDNDHAGGAEILLKHFPSAALFNSSERDYGAKQQQPCIQGQSWAWREFRFEVFAPSQLSKIAKNRDSCVLLVTRGKVRFVLSGDVYQATENRIAPSIGKVDWLQVGHHGSNTSSGWLWLKHLQPQLSLISSGLYNQWNLPHFATQNRLQQIQSAVYNTATDGQITLSVTQDQWQISTQRRGVIPWYHIIIGLEKEIQLE